MGGSGITKWISKRLKGVSSSSNLLNLVNEPTASAADGTNRRRASSSSSSVTSNNRRRRKSTTSSSSSSSSSSGSKKDSTIRASRRTTASTVNVKGSNDSLESLQRHIRDLQQQEQQQQQQQQQHDQQEQRGKRATTKAPAATVAAVVEDKKKKSGNVKIVEKWIELWRIKDLVGVVTMSAPDCEYLVPVEDSEDLHVALQDFIDQMHLCYESFPDYNSYWESVEESTEHKGGIVIRNFYSTATHTGKPFAFGPFPAIPASGAPIKDDCISLVVFLKDGKPHRIRAESKGTQMGPPLYYTQIGGLII